jgi:hypothetical protein
MPRRVFYSFHYERDAWRAAQVRSMGLIDGNRPTSDNNWEEIARGGDSAIKRWINSQMDGKSCAVVLIGSETAGRKWINYEILTAWDRGLGVVGVYIHRLKDQLGKQASQGGNPFAQFFSKDNTRMDQIVESHLSDYRSSEETYDWIKENLSEWVETAIHIRSSWE